MQRYNNAFFFKKQNNISPQVRVVRIGEEGEKILGEEGTKKKEQVSVSQKIAICVAFKIFNIVR